MKLGDHIKAVKKPDQSIGEVIDAFAHRIDVYPATVRRYMDGTRRPRWDILTRIERETGGHVTANDFVEPISKDRRRTRQAQSVA
jgi:DNA-binding transcriptional regulator YdaS (Cro superfamily)